MKKILSVLLALTLALSLSVMSFAAPATAYDKLIEFIHSDTVKDGLKTVLDEVGIYDEVIAAVHTDDFKANFKALIDGAENFDTAQLAGWWDDLIKEIADKTGVEIEDVKEALSKTGLFNWVANLYMPAAPVTTTAPATTTSVSVPETGSAVGGLAIFATLSLAAAAAFVATKKN